MKKVLKARRITGLLVVFFLVVFFGYIVFASHIAALGYTLERLEQKRVSLQETESEFVVELAHRQHPGALEETLAGLQLVEHSGEPRYIDVREGQVTLRSAQ